MLRTARPTARLAPFVEALWFYEGERLEGAERVLPSGRMQLLVSLADSVEGMAPVTLTGPSTRPALVERTAFRRIVGVQFRAGGAWPFAGVPCSTLVDLDLDLGALWGRRAAELREVLLEEAAATAVDPEDRVLARLERSLLERVPAPTGLEPALRRALLRLEAGRPVREVVEESGLSRATLTRRLHERVGLGPKQVASLARFQRAVRALARSPRDLAEVALAAGYYDQSHLTHAFRRYAEMTPRTYRPLSSEEPNHVPLET